jgi:hypothetical protein
MSRFLLFVLSISCLLKVSANAINTIPQEIYSLVATTEKALSFKTLMAVIIDGGYTEKNGKQEPRGYPNQKKLILDKSGKIWKLLIEIKPLVPTGKGKNQNPINPDIQLFDGKFRWIYDPLLNVYTKKLDSGWPIYASKFELGFLILSRELLEQSKPYLKNASLQRAKFEGKDAYLITLTYPGDHQRVYLIDAEKYLPLQGEYITPSKEGKSIERYKVTEWKRDIKLPSNAFVLKPPKGAKEVDWQTYQELQKQFNQKAGLHNKSILEGGK